LLYAAASPRTDWTTGNSRAALNENSDYHCTTPHTYHTVLAAYNSTPSETTSSNATAYAKISIHNSIQDGFTRKLAPILATAGYILPNFTLDLEPQLYLQSDPHARPFNISFDPFPAIPPNANHGCHYTTIGADIIVSCTPPCPNLDPTSADVITTIMANADSHLQTYEQGKLGHNNKTDKSTLITTIGDTTISNIIDRNMLLFPFAFDPLGRFGPILQHFLFNMPPTTPLQFPPSKPKVTKMYNRILHFPSPKGILNLAEHNWSNLNHNSSTDTPTLLLHLHLQPYNNLASLYQKPLPATSVMHQESSPTTLHIYSHHQAFPILPLMVTR
jgi:hypothetical protein